jgi:hypothetical protein
MQPVNRPVAATACLLLLAAACQSPAAELSGLSERPPLDYAVLVTGGAFLQPSALGGPGTFAGAQPGVQEPVRIQSVVDVLRAGAVFQRVAVDADDGHRKTVLDKLGGKGVDQDLLAFLQQTRDDGYDLLLVVEQLQDGPLDAHGINSRWPVTLATWLLLGVGMFIPDHTFESGATLRVTMRDLQTGSVVFDTLSPAGPVDMSLVERSDTWGLILSIIVPPFWVHTDGDTVRQGMRDITERRLLLSLARELKSEPTRLRLRERSVATMSLAGGRRLQVDAAESLSAVRLRPLERELDTAIGQQFEQELLASLLHQGNRFVYEAELPDDVPAGALQVLVATIQANVSSATLVAGEPR